MSQCLNSTMNCIIDAFAEIEKHDIRVYKVVLEREKYYELATSKDFQLSYVNNPILMQNQLSSAVNGKKRIGQLWGADFELGDESKVYGEPGYLPETNRSNVYGEHDCLSETNFRPIIRPFPKPGERLPQYSVNIFCNSRIFKAKFKKNLTIIVKTRANFFYRIPKNEWAAIETLREMISETEFRKYMKYGFILVRGQTGNTYQIFRDKSHTRIWRDGKVIEEVCVRIAHEANVPPTDNVIAFKTMIECSEQEFKKSGNVYKMLKVA